MISSDIIRGYTDTMILFILLDEDSYGYEISKQIRSLTQEKYVMKETTLYSALKRLEASGQIESYSSTEPNGKNRTYYHITQEGKSAYQNKVEEWSITQEVVNQFITKENKNGNN